MENLTFAVLLTAAGAGIAATLVTSLISLVKTAIPIATDWNGGVLAFAASAVLYILAGVATGVGTLDAGLNVFIAWLTCATAAVGVHTFIIKPVVKQIKQDDPKVPPAE